MHWIDGLRELADQIGDAAEKEVQSDEAQCKPQLRTATGAASRTSEAALEIDEGRKVPIPLVGPGVRAAILKPEPEVGGK